MGGLESEQERREGGVEASLGLSGNLNGVETGLQATQQIHLNAARAISYQEFREGTICPLNSPGVCRDLACILSSNAGIFW